MHVPSDSSIYLKSNRHATAAHHRQNGAIPFQLPKFVNLCHVDAISSGLTTLQEKNALAERTAYLRLPAQRIDKF